MKRPLTPALSHGERGVDSRASGNDEHLGAMMKVGNSIG